MWAPDVRSTQLADVLAGIKPLRSAIKVGAGMADLVLLPMASYRRDGRVSRGVHQGATSFAKATALEALKIGASLASGTQVVLEQAEHALQGDVKDPSGTLSEGDMTQSIFIAPQSKYAQQPEDARAGLLAAYQSLSSNLHSAAQTILAVPMEVHERSENVSVVVRLYP